MHDISTTDAMRLAARRRVSESHGSARNQFAGIYRPGTARESWLSRVADCIAQLRRVRNRLTAHTASTMQSVQAASLRPIFWVWGLSPLFTITGEPEERS